MTYREANELNNSKQSEHTLSEEQRSANFLSSLFDRADRVLVKKLANNDRDWASNANKHQGGVYIPHVQRDGGFFPPLTEMHRNDPKAKTIRERYIDTTWPQSAEKKLSRLVNYTSKGQETHMTRLPSPAFSDLSPASFLVMGRIGTTKEVSYECLTIDSADEEANLLQDLFDLSPDFLIDEFNPAELKRHEQERILDFSEEIISAWTLGELEELALLHTTLPTTVELARMAQNVYLAEHVIGSLNPFKIENPGDVLREISRRIELDIFKEFQRKKRSIDLIRIVLGSTPVKMNAANIIKALVDNLAAIDALMLSASQQRKSRAGYSYEHHIETMLSDGHIPFEKQVVIQAKKRPDFVLPSLAFLDSGKPGASEGLILSAKTTLRERWKQVEREKGDRDLYLTTVDENIASNAIEDMASIGIKLVIPEKLKKAKESEYQGHKNVLSFREFCDHVVQPKLGHWRA